MMDDEACRRALRHAIDVMTIWDKKNPGATFYNIPDDIAALRGMLVDVRQLPLPLEKAKR